MGRWGMDVSGIGRFEMEEGRMMGGEYWERGKGCWRGKGGKLTGCGAWAALAPSLCSRSGICRRASWSSSRL